MSKPFLIPKITFDGRELEGLGDKLRRFPSASWIATTLQRTGKALVPHVQESMKDHFVIRRKWILKGVASTQVEKTNLRVEVGSRDWFMKDQVESGKRQAQQHRIAVPMYIRKNISEDLKKAKRPAQILAKQKVGGF